LNINLDKFFNEIPKSLEENTKFRKKLHTYLESRPDEQDKFIRLCLIDPKCAFNTCLWTQNPRGNPGFRNWPFILRPKQEEMVDLLVKCTTPPYSDMGINKSRDEGCTEVICKMAAIYLFEPDTYIIVGSRNKDLVDCLGDPYTLMAKIDYAIKTMPAWMREKLGPIDRKEMQLSVPKYNSTIKGETTNENFSAGRRATWMFLDEFGRVKPRIAESIEGSVHDVTDCVVYGSTHWYGETHPFNEALKKKTTKVINLPWWENPNKKKGLYKSPDYNVVEIVDVEYYKQHYPDIQLLHSSKPFKSSELDEELRRINYKGEIPQFIADKCEGLPGNLRSPWHDAEEEKRKGYKRDFLSNVWMSPIGAQSSFFDGTVLERINDEFICWPKYEGELDFRYDVDGRVASEVHFAENRGRKRLKWWGSLSHGRPYQEYNYVIGCDLSMGSGNSNSVAAIYCVHTQELVGTWVCPNTRPDKFMDLVVALARWCGGLSGEALIIYETNGPGVNAHKRLLFNGHRRIYTQRAEDSKRVTRKNKYGWSSNLNAKESLLGDFGIALSESLRVSDARRCIIYDEELLHELYQYVFYESGDIGVSSGQDETSGARKRHGDRVIAASLAVLGAKYQNSGHPSEMDETPVNTFKYLLEQEALKQKRLKREMRRYLY